MSTTPPGSHRRVDARRNRERLLEAARRGFATAGGTLPLEAVAREAGVGIGTLYRNFPTREALVEAVYAAELDAVIASANHLLATRPPQDALRAWMDRYADFVATKRGMIGTLRAGWVSGRIQTSTTRERITATIADFLAAGVRTGTLRSDVDPDDATALLLGVFLSALSSAGDAVAAEDPPASGEQNAPVTSEQTGRMLDLLVDALRSPAARAGPE